MTAVEDRLTAALVERADAIGEFPGSWKRNQQLLAQRSSTTAARRYRAPLLVAAAVLALIASVVTVRSVQRTADPVAPAPIGNADAGGCRFGAMPGVTDPGWSARYEPAETSGNRLVVLMNQTNQPNACFFDGVGWHYVAGSAGSPLEILQTSTADGQSWLWGLVRPGALKLQIEQNGGVTSTISTSDTFMAPVKASGTVTLTTESGNVIATQSFDLTKASTSVGPVVKQSSTWNSTNAGGQAIACPAGAADATAVQPVPGAAAVTLALHSRGALGEPVVCASGGLGPIAGVVYGFSGLDAMIIHNVDSTPRLWGVVPEEVAKIVVTTGEGVGTSTFVADPAKAVDGAVVMSKLGDYRTFAAVAVLVAGASRLQLYAADGSSITSLQL